MKPDRRIKLDNRPLYVKAVDALKLLIAQVPYKSGDKLPSEGELADLLGISRTTLRMAMGHLELAGIIVRKQGIGTFVSQPVPVKFRGGMESLTSVHSLAKSAGLNTETTEREVSVVSATAGQAETLEVEIESALNQVKCTVSIEGLPVAYLNTLAPASVAGIEELGRATGSLLEFLIERGEPNPSHTHSQIYAIQAEKSLASRLKIAEGQALLYLVETYFTKAGTPIALSNNYFVSDRFGFYISRHISR